MTKTIAALQSEVAAAARVYYHGTAATFVDSIKAHGLIPRDKPGADSWARDHMPKLVSPDRCVFVARARNQAARFASLTASVNHATHGALFTIRFPRSARLIQDVHSHAEMDGAAKYFGVIPPAWLRLVALTPVRKEDIDVLTGKDPVANFQSALASMLEKYRDDSDD